MQYTLKVYHGGQVLKKYDVLEFKPARRKGRQEYGVGLYSTIVYSYARLYSRYINELELVLDTNSISTIILAPVNELLEFVRITFTKKFYKQFDVDFNGKDKISLRRFYVYLHHNLRDIHKYEKDINDLFLMYGAKYTVEQGTEGYIVIVHDFSIIKNVQKASSYDDYVLPKEIKDLSYRWL